MRGILRPLPSKESHRETIEKIHTVSRERVCGDGRLRELVKRESKRDVKNSARFGSAVPVTCGPAPVKYGPRKSWSPHALPAPEYRPGLRAGSDPRALEVIRDAFP